ncbi:Phosphoribosylanthranilate isomerase [Dissulfuribacter thermophilus]|uniref:N-(5'-phosphoribosyl)anthranilate isomerase n=1 Tax=Dissulfuribacter thermophilus TaxID=1156395 RepID=A0A1B9F842_9BACT|nr:phosphoribosylanthranilate isomerase [Dissulfuribacter thermophilus]OCC16118.1 Phosphoribosylanthranilate isomerase [Dissulfuribacter thermophilus]
MIKICGITNLEDLKLIASLRPDAVGFVFARSPRQVGIEAVKKMVDELPPGISTFGVFVNPEKDLVDFAIREAGIDIVQLHGDESPEFCKLFPQRVVKALRVKADDDLDRFKVYEPYVRGFLVDAWCAQSYGGTGKRVDLELAKRLCGMFKRPVILAGGLDPSNLDEVLTCVQPFGVDVSSGVEERPGKKDLKRVKDFIIIARRFGL